jgi:hypothetical protein
VIKIIATDGEAGASLAAERRYRGARDGRRVAFQAAADRADRQLRRGPSKDYSTALNRPRGTTFGSLRYRRGSISMGALISAYKFKPPRRGESFVSLLCSTLAIPHHCIPLSPNIKAQRTGDHRHAFFHPSPALKTLAPRFSACHLSFLRTLRRHSSILAE